MKDYEMDEDVVCPHCHAVQEDDISRDQLENHIPVRWTCADCKKDFSVERVIVSKYNSWDGRSEFYQ